MKIQDIEARKKRRTVGAIAISLLILFTILSFIGYLNLFEWLIADVIVALAANFILRRLAREQKTVKKAKS